MDQGIMGRIWKKRVFARALIAHFGIAVCFLFMTALPLNAEEVQEAPEEIVINNAVYKTDRKGSVLFLHSEHADGYVESCDGCHHEYKDGKNIWEEGQPVKKCSSCHDPAKSNGRIKKLNIAYHKNCKGCHRELAREGGTQAPYRQCTDCHAKR